MIPDRILVLAAAATLSLAPAASAQSRGIPATYRAAADSLIRAATRDSAAYDRVGRLVDGFGHRLAGSRSLEAAIDWILQEMKRDGLENVRGEPVAVAHWVRGEESVVLVRPRRDTLGMLGLGGSVATPRAGITAPVLVVQGTADTGVFPSDARKIFDFLGSSDKTLELIPGAHYFEDSIEERQNAADLVGAWIREKL